MTDVPSLYGSAADPVELVEVLRRRKQELQITDQELDRIAGLTSGHSGKLLGAARVKRFGELSLFLMLGALGLRLAVVIDENASRKFSGQAEQSVQSSRMLARATKGRYSVGPLSRKVIHRALVTAGRKAARLGGIARAARLSPARRVQIARRAARARWARWRIARRAAKARARKKITAAASGANGARDASGG